jgi:hypothetical protein
MALRKKLGAWRWVLPIEIMAAQAASVVANYYSIRVEHGDNFKNKSFSKNPRGFLITDEVLDEALHDEAAVRLSWVDPATQNDALAFGDGIL